MRNGRSNGRNQKVPFAVVLEPFTGTCVRTWAATAEEALASSHRTVACGAAAAEAGNATGLIQSQRERFPEARTALERAAAAGNPRAHMHGVSASPASGPAMGMGRSQAGDAWNPAPRIRPRGFRANGSLPCRPPGRPG